MFTWICPKCGREVPPAYAECPNCAAAPAVQPAADATAHTDPVPSPAAVRPAFPLTPPPPAAGPAGARPSEPRKAPSGGLSPTAVAAGAALAILALLAVLYLVLLPRWSDSGPAAGAPAAPALQNAGGAGSSEAPHPMAKHLEVAGVRVTPAKPGTARVQFLVINHSAADLPEMALDLTLRPAAGGSAVFEFQVKLPSIGPYESRELTSLVNTPLKPYEFPDWQAVRTGFRLRSE